MENTPTHEEIAREAYEVWLERGEGTGRDLDDWLAAEQRLIHNQSPTRPRDEFLKLREEYNKILYAESAAYDKAILTLGAAAIGVSLLFLKDIIKVPIQAIWLLREAWVTLTLSMMATVAALLTSQWKLRRQLENLDREQEVKSQLSDKPKVRVRFLNLLAGLLLAIGVLFLAMFALENI